MRQSTDRERIQDLWPALAYGLAYVPFAILVGRPEKDLFVTSAACWAVMMASVTILRQWGKVQITRTTVACAVCTSGIILSTIVGLGLHGVSMLLMAVLMRAGVLAMSPILDMIRGHVIRPQSRLALVLTLSAVLCAVWGRATVQITPAALLTVGIYLACYALRLHLYGATKKNAQDAHRLLVSDQVLAVTLTLALTGLWRVLARDPGHVQVHGLHWFLVPVAVGVLSQATGVFGAMVFAGRREHTFNAPLNRAMSTLAVCAASLIMGKRVTGLEGVGVGLIVAAVFVMAVPWARVIPQPFRR